MTKMLTCALHEHYATPEARKEAADQGNPGHAAWRGKAKPSYFLTPSDESALVAIVDLASWLFHSVVYSGPGHAAKTIKEACSKIREEIFLGLPKSDSILTRSLRGSNRRLFNEETLL